MFLVILKIHSVGSAEKQEISLFSLVRVSLKILPCSIDCLLLNITVKKYFSTGNLYIYANITKICL